MAKRKTKKQKKITAARRIVTSKSKPNRKQRERAVEFGYDINLIKKDLSKTIGVSLLIIVLELIIYFTLTK